ncbi:MAG: hypothetical protein J6034_07125, partial [Bacteroidaceae bacterium]|nr:hypothetical protein [Bacteroidaceae bacterium]
MIRLLPKERKNKSASLLLVLPNLSLELCSLAIEGTIGRAANSHNFYAAEFLRPFGSKRTKFERGNLAELR